MLDGLRTAVPRDKPAVLVAGAALLVVLTAVIAAATGPDANPVSPAIPVPPGPAAAVPGPPRSEPAATSGVATTLRSTTVLAEPRPGAEPVSRLRAGIVLPVTESRDGFVAVLSPCQYQGWVTEADVSVQAPWPVQPFPKPLEAATFVLDPGHGGRSQPGAVGPTGLTETEANADIVARLVEQLSQPRDVDWQTGRITDGSRYGRPRVIVTRDDDHVAGLTYRAALANAIRADAFVSVHNNAEPDGPFDGPGTETYYQLRSAESKRLAGLAYQEVRDALARYEGVAWVGDRDAGAKYRTNEQGQDYYGLLRRSLVPATLVEAAFISNAPEEALLRRPDVRQGIADALYRALVRYVTTDHPGSGFVEPYARGSVPSGALPPACVDPV